MTSNIADFYDVNHVKVGQAVLYVAAKNTALPADTLSIDEFDATSFLGQTIVPYATTTTYTVGGVTSSAVTTAGVTIAQVVAAIEALSTVGVGNVRVSVPLGGAIATSQRIALTGTAKGQAITIGGTGTAGSVTAVTGWVPAGATEQGWGVAFSQNTQDINIEEQQLPVDRQVTDATLQISANLSQDDYQQLQWAYNATSVLTAAGSGQPSKRVMSLQTTLLHYAICLEGENDYGYARRIYVPDVTSAASGTMNFRRAAQQRLLPVTFASVSNIDQIKIIDYLANGT